MSSKASGKARPSRRLAPRQRHQCRGRADLPDHACTSSTAPSTQPTCWASGTGQHLHPHHEPDRQHVPNASPPSKAVSLLWASRRSGRVLGTTDAVNVARQR